MLQLFIYHCMIDSAPAEETFKENAFHVSEMACVIQHTIPFLRGLIMLFGVSIFRAISRQSLDYITLQTSQICVLVSGFRMQNLPA